MVRIRSVVSNQSKTRESKIEIARQKEKDTLANDYAAESILLSVFMREYAGPSNDSFTPKCHSMRLFHSLFLILISPPSSLKKLTLSLRFSHSSLFKHTLLIQTLCVYNSYPEYEVFSSLLPYIASMFHLSTSIFPPFLVLFLLWMR